jgi:glycosyltransferase involved in cell wall biosynthesis
MVGVSIIIPTYNRCAQLKRVLQALEAQDFPLNTFEVIVVSDGSTDGTAEFLTTVATPLQLRPVLQNNRGVAAARNRGIAEARGALVLFIDDDVVPTPGFIMEHVDRHIAAGANAVVLGPMLTPPDFQMTPWVAWEQTMLTKQYDALAQGLWEPTARQFYTGNSSLARRHLQAVGGFDPTYRRAEDVELAYRLESQGLRFLFNFQAVGYHYAERSFASWFQIPYAYGKNDVIFTQQNGRGWLLPVIWREYMTRNRLVRLLTQTCLDRPLISRMAMAMLKQSAIWSYKAGLKRVSYAACSGLFNLRYYQGVADQLGGRALFFTGVARTAQAAQATGTRPNAPAAAPNKVK